MNIISYIHLSNLKDIVNLRDENNCMRVEESQNKWTLCAETQDKVNKWVCIISARVQNLDVEKECQEKNFITKAVTKIINRKIEQPYIIIPTSQEYCNAKWDYEKKGADWECICREGKEQSPIDLPLANNAIESPKKPIFNYKKVDLVHKDPANNGNIKSNSPMKIEHFNNAMRIFHNNLGQMVTLDGTIYQAEEIVFHTPSEHTINGEKFPLEVQVVHRAITKGDFGKKSILSFLFKGKAGIYNKFIENLDFFSLPNPYTKSRQLYEKVFVPNLLIETSEIEPSVMLPFSFYTYQGSLTEPPCTENVIHYVTSKPIEVSITALELFKEALREPDFEDTEGNLILAEPKSLSNSRATQNLNGRAVFHYDHNKFDIPILNLQNEETEETNRGHYEKQEKEAVEYIFIEGTKPSGLPGAIVVPNEEAEK